MISFVGGYQLSQSTVLSYEFLSHLSSRCKYKRHERAMLNIQHSLRVQSLLVVFKDVIDLLWLLVPVRLEDPRSHAPECPILRLVLCWTLY